MKTLPLLVLLLLIPLLTGFTESKARKVTLVWLGDVSSPEQRLVKKALEGYYKIRIEERSVAEIPASLYINATDTLNGTSVLSYLQNLNPNPTGKIVALTGTALSMGNGGYTIRGLANEKLNSSVISTAKLKLQSESDQEFKLNLLKVARHEYGHLLGLEHCELNETCLMITGHDRKDFLAKMGTALCKQCNRKVSFGLR